MITWIKHNNNYWTCHKIDENNVVQTDKIQGGIVKNKALYGFFIGYPGQVINASISTFNECRYYVEKLMCFGDQDDVDD